MVIVLSLRSSLHRFRWEKTIGGMDKRWYSTEGTQTESRDREVYGMLGEETFHQLAASFYKKVKQDDILLPMYQHSQHHRGEPDLSLSESRLCDFLIGRFGGPQRYIEQHGHPRLRFRHNPFPIDQKARDRWMAHMETCMEEVLGNDKTTVPYRELHTFFRSMSQFMINRPSA